MGTKVCITETWIAAAVSGFRLGKPSTAILIGSFKNFPQDLFIFCVFLRKLELKTQPCLSDLKNYQ